MDNNKKSLNLSKTKAMIFGEYKVNDGIQIQVENEQIEIVKETKLLGQILDNKN